MKLKLDDKGNVVLQDGKPVYIMDDGAEVAFDAVAVTKKIATLNTEAKDNRLKLTDLTTKLEAFADLDPVAAKAALEKVTSLQGKKLLDTGEVDKLKADIEAGWKTKLDKAIGELDTLKGQLVEEKIGGSFARSKFIAEKLAIPSDVVQAFFGKNFKLEEGRVNAYDGNGNLIRSRENPSVAAPFEEALSVLVDGYANKATILKGTQKPGGGTTPAGGGGGGGGGDGKKTLNRAEFGKLDPVSQAKHFADGGALVD